MRHRLRRHGRCRRLSRPVETWHLTRRLPLHFPHLPTLLTFGRLESRLRAIFATHLGSGHFTARRSHIRLVSPTLDLRPHLRRTPEATIRLHRPTFGCRNLATLRPPGLHHTTGKLAIRPQLTAFVPHRLPFRNGTTHLGGRHFLAGRRKRRLRQAPLAATTGRLPAHWATRTNALIDDIARLARHITVPIADGIPTHFRSTTGLATPTVHIGRHLTIRHGQGAPGISLGKIWPPAIALATRHSTAPIHPFTTVRAGCTRRRRYP